MKAEEEILQSLGKQKLQVPNFLSALHSWTPLKSARKVVYFRVLVEFHLQEAKMMTLDPKACHIPAEAWLPSLRW